MNKMNKMIILSALTIVIFSTIVSAIGGETFDLIADGGDVTTEIDVGDVSVSDDGTNLYVTYTTTGGWCMTETHLQVATSEGAIPQTKKNNPIPGKFEYFGDHDPCETQVEYTIPIPDGCGEGDEVIIAAHTAVQLFVEVDPDTGEDIFRYETAWGEGEEDEEFDGRNWAMYFTYEIVD